MAGVPTLQLNVGRQRHTKVVGPSEAAYMSQIQAQLRELRENMLKVVQHVDKVTPEAILYGLKPIMDESQRLVPVDTGTLKRSGFMEVRRTAGGIAAAIGYGRYGRPTYTAFVHENLNVRHRAPTQAKFLEVAINTKIGDFRRRVEMFMLRTMPGADK